MKYGKLLLLFSLVLFLSVFIYSNDDLKINLRHMYRPQLINVSEDLPVVLCEYFGGEIINENELGFRVIHNPRKLCALLYDDAGNSCFDNNDCIGACILPRKMNDLDDNTWGECQKYKFGSVNCKTERRNGIITSHPCLIE